MVHKKPCLGWREWISLPDLSVGKIKAKIDSGAKTSCLHAYNIQILKKGKKTWAKFKLHPLQGQSDVEVAAKARVIDERWVRSSTGHATLRPVIITEMTAGEQSWPIEITLLNRDVMGFRMLVGREALKGRFLIDPGGSFLLRKKKRKTQKKVKKDDAE